MSEVMSREQFLLWRDKVTDFLEATGSAGITPLLEALHTRRSECSVMDAVGIANGRGVGIGGHVRHHQGQAQHHGTQSVP